VNLTLKNFLRRTCAVAFGERVISIRGECGQRFWFRPSEYPSLLFGLSSFETHYLQGWKGLLQPTDLIADVGANIGLTVQRFYSICRGQCRIFAFELSPRNLSLLERNVEEIGGSNITICRHAVSHAEGEVLFTENVEHGGLSRISSLDRSKPRRPELWKRENQIKVKAVTLDNYFLSGTPQVQPPSFIKVDVEGAGGQVLAGAIQLLKCQRPALCCSFHCREEIELITQAVASCGYRSLHFSEDSGWQWCEPSNSEGYFVHPSDPRLERMSL
jgi:FkbM family methyltransferase